MTDQRLLDLLVDRETGDLDRKDRIALAGMDHQNFLDLEDELGLAAAAAMLAFEDDQDIEKLPAELHIHIAEDAKLFFANAAAPRTVERDDAVVTPFPSTEPVAEKGASSLVQWFGWLVAAAVLTFVFLPKDEVISPEQRLKIETDLRAQIQREIDAQQPPVLTPAEERAQLLAAQSAQPLPWQALPDAAAEGASGDVVWSDERQQGFMRINGLAVNNPEEYQYQLWIFDKNGDERYPVDGGVFDIPVGAGEVVIPIDAKIGVQEPQLYAITIEKPGGVVVSGRDRIVLLAKPGQG